MPVIEGLIKARASAVEGSGGLFTLPNRPLNHKIVYKPDAGEPGLGQFQAITAGGKTLTHDPKSTDDLEAVDSAGGEHNRVHDLDLPPQAIRDTNSALPSDLQDPAHG